MANKVYNMEGGLHSAAAYSAFENSMWGSCVASSSDFVATAGTGMNISLSAGNGMIDTGLGFSRRIASDAVNTISVDAASSANPRKDALVAYIDNGVTPTTSVLDNTNDILKFACVAGSPAATPAAPSDATIQTAIGAGNPYVVLWYVTVPKSATSLSTATFTDNRNISSKIDGSNIKDGTVTSSKIDWTSLTPAYYYEVWQYAATTGQEHGSTAIAGTYTQDTTLFSVNFTPKTSGKFLVTMVLPARGGTSGTGFVRLVVDSTQRWCAVPKSGDNSFNTNVITMVFNGNAGTTYSVKMMTLRSNTESITIPDYMGASISIVEL